MLTFFRTCFETCFPKYIYQLRCSVMTIVVSEILPRRRNIAKGRWRRCNGRWQIAKTRRDDREVVKILSHICHCQSAIVLYEFTFRHCPFAIVQSRFAIVPSPLYFHVSPLSLHVYFLAPSRLLPCPFVPSMSSSKMHVFDLRRPFAFSCKARWP